GRLQSRSPGLTVVQTPEWRIEFAQNEDGPEQRFGENLPDHFDADASLVDQNGHTLLYFPGRLVNGDQNIPILILLGERARIGTNVIFDEPTTTRPVLIRPWIAWRVGGHGFRRPALP